MRRSKDSGDDGDLHNSPCVVESEAESGATVAYSESHQLSQGEGGDGDSRAIKRSVFKSVVYGSEEEWVTPVDSRFATSEQGHDPELRSRSDSGRICGSVCRTRDILH